MRILLRKLSLTRLEGTAKDTAIIFTTYLTTSILAFFYTVILARAFSPGNLGVFSAVSAFILLTADVLDLGISASLTRFYPEIRHKEGEGKAAFFLGNTFKFQLLITIFLVLLIIPLGPFLSRFMFHSTSFSNLFIFAAIGILATVMLAYSSASLSAQKKFSKVSLIIITSTLFKLGLMLILFIADKFSLANVTASFALAPLIAFSFSLKFINLSYFKKKFNFHLIRKLLSYSAFIAAARVLSAISSRFDALMLIPLSSAYDAGIYSAAYKIVFTYILFAGSFSTVISPRLSAFRTVKESFPYLKKVIIVVLLMHFSMIIMYFLAPAIVPFILGSKYLPSISVFRGLLLPAALFVATIPTVNFLLFVVKKPQVSAFNTLVQFLVIILGNFYFIPKFGSFGPIYTLTISYGFTLISTIYFSWYFIKHE